MVHVFSFVIMVCRASGLLYLLPRGGLVLMKIRVLKGPVPSLVKGYVVVNIDATCTLRYFRATHTCTHTHVHNLCVICCINFYLSVAAVDVQ